MSDDHARAARRARVLAAVAREPATPPAMALAPMRRSAWRRGGWLAAASVAGLALFAVTQVYHPIPRQPQAASTAPAAGIPQASVGAKPAGPSTPSSPKSAAPQALAAAPAPAPTASPVEVLPATPPAPSLAIPPPAPRAFSAEAAAPPPPPVVAAQAWDAPADAADDMQQRSGGAADEAVESRRAAKQAPMAAFAAPSTRSEAAAGSAVRPRGGTARRGRRRPDSRGAGLAGPGRSRRCAGRRWRHRPHEERPGGPCGHRRSPAPARRKPGPREPRWRAGAGHGGGQGRRRPQQGGRLNLAPIAWAARLRAGATYAFFWKRET